MMNIFKQTLVRFKPSQPILTIIQDLRNEFNLKFFKSFDLTIQDVLNKFQLLEKKYSNRKNHQNSIEWKEDQKKVLFSFLAAFCHLHLKKISQITKSEWNQISSSFHNKPVMSMMYQAKSIEKPCQRAIWQSIQQSELNTCIKTQMKGKWADISRHIFFSTEGAHYKTPKQCREHWFNHMSKSIKHGNWNIEQDMIILESVLDNGHKWARIVDLLDGKRTQHMIKNRFYSLLTCSNKMYRGNKQSVNSNRLVRILIEELTKQKKNKKKDNSLKLTKNLNRNRKKLQVQLISNSSNLDKEEDIQKQQCFIEQNIPNKEQIQLYPSQYNPKGLEVEEQPTYKFSTQHFPNFLNNPFPQLQYYYNFTTPYNPNLYFQIIPTYTNYN